MNSADRSISFVDYALRRRFYIIEFYPDVHKEVLELWCNDNLGNDDEINYHNLNALLEKINERIVEDIGREYQIGYSYLMVKDLDRINLERIWKYAIYPLIEQYFFGKKEKIKEIAEIFGSLFAPVNPLISNYKDTTEDIVPLS